MDIAKIAHTEHTILITGKTGTGKSHLARTIHDLSHRREKRFVVVNLATLHENILESELFGHERGAFSGADQKRIGKLEFANEGTVFLDEIGELSLRLQVKLLEALNSKTVCAVGSNREVKLNVRIIAATNQPLEKMVEAGSFREDLFYRINTFQIALPDIKEDKGKICELATKFSIESGKSQGRDFLGFQEGFLSALEAYDWPGNIRELKNALEFAVAMSADGFLAEENLPPYIRKRMLDGEKPTIQEFPAYFFQDNYYESKAAFERKFLEEMLRRNEGKINQTARITQLSKVTLIEKIRKYNIDINRIKYTRYLESSMV